MLCFDSELPPSRPWIRAPHVVAVALGPERFALAVARHGANGVEIVRAAEHRLDTLIGRVPDACATFDVRRIDVRGDQLSSLPDLGTPLLRFRVAYADPRVRAVSPVLASDLLFDAAELAATVAARLPSTPIDNAIRRRFLSF